MSELPSGTVTFLFTDIEGSTRRWEGHPAEMAVALARHDSIMREAIEGNGGYIFKTIGDAFCAAFSIPHDALEAAIHAQNLLFAEDWGEATGSVRVRMALHTGVAEERARDYFGQPVNRVARLLSAGHGGQTLLSNSTYDMVRDTLAQGVRVLDLGEHRLKDLTRPEHIFLAVAEGNGAQFPPLKTLDNRPNNLPRQTTAFIGREKEVGNVCVMLRRADVALITLTGPGGTGKTRLSMQVGAELLDEFPDGVWFVELAALTDHNLVISTIAQTLGVTEAAGRPLIENLKDYLREKQTLLIMDNFEQVVGAAKQVGELLATCPALKMIATSRIPLRIRAEKEYAVPPLGLPPARAGHAPPLRLELLTQYEAVRLFIERATDVKADFEVTNENAPAVAEICVRLDGLPLAIELAAARIRLFPPQALLGRLSSRLKMLTGGARDLTARQQTLRGAIDWSYDLLDDVEKQFFRRLSVFLGGRTLEAIEAVCNAEGDLQVDVLDGVESLVSKSQMRQEEGAGAEPRFVMLETIHEYAREKLEACGEGPPIRRRHAEYFMGMAVEADDGLRGPDQARWLAQLDDEHANMRAALGWARSAEADSMQPSQLSPVEIGLRLAGAIYRYWLIRGYLTEGRERLEELLAISGTEETSHSKAKALLRVGGLAWSQGDYAAARSVLEKSLAMYRELADKNGIALALLNLGNVALYEVDYPSARALYEESHAIYQELGDQYGIVNALHNAAIVAQYQHDNEAARLMLQKCLEISRALGDKMGIAQLLNSLGDIASNLGEPASARAYYRGGLAANQALGYKWGLIESLEGLAKVTGSGMALDAFAASVDRDKLLLEAARLWGAAQLLRETIGAPMPPPDIEAYERNIAIARSRVEESAWEEAWAKGRAMPLERVVGYALEEEEH
jgi:predicted ATPase/class 3 adenylate cyclase